MDPSRRAYRSVTCPAGHDFAADIWDVVDLGVHPELRVSPELLLSVSCSVCQASTDLGTPLLLLNSLPDVPIVSVCDWARDDLEGRVKVARTIGAPIPPPPGFVVATTRSTLSLLFTCTDSVELRRRIASAAVGATQLATVDHELARELDVLAIARTAVFLLTFPKSDIPPADLRDPTLLSRVSGNAEILEYLGANADELAAQDSDPRIFAQRRLFVERLVAGMDPDRAQEELNAGIAAVVAEEIGPELGEVLVGLQDDGISGPARLELFVRAIELAQVVGDRNLEAFLRTERVSMVATGGIFYEAEVMKLAELDLRRAVELTAEGSDQALHARSSANLAIILGSKSTGDRSDNIEEAIRLVRCSLEFFTEESAPDFWAMNCTNLAVLYVRRQAGDRLQNLRTAEDLCQAALRVRSVQRNAIDWAYTITNLAYALIERAGISDSDARELLGQGLTLSEQAAAEFAKAGAAQLAADALHNAAAAAQAQVLRSLADQARHNAAAVASHPEVKSAVHRSGMTEGSIPERIVQAAQLVKSNPTAFGLSSAPEWVTPITNPVLTDSDRTLLDQGMRLSSRARSIRAATPGIALAMSCLQWDDLQQVAGASDRDRIANLAKALTLFSVDDQPEAMLDLAARLGGIHSKQRDWKKAADAYEIACAALDWIYRELGNQVSRLAELSTHYKLVEFAAYAMAMAGRPGQAVVLLENGRTRGLGAAIERDSADMARLRDLAPALAADLDHVQRRLGDLSRSADDRGRASEPSHDDIASASLLRQELRGLLDRIRSLDGFADFMTGMPARGIAQISRADDLLAYLVTSPAGSLTLLVEPCDSAGTADTLRVTVLHSEITSNQLYAA